MRYLVPASGYSQNPLCNSKIRNFSCPCGSQKKIKKCCGRVNYIPDEYREPLASWVDQVEQAMGDDSPMELRAMLKEYAEKNQNELVINQAKGAFNAE